MYKSIYCSKITKIVKKCNVQQYILAYSQNGILFHNENFKNYKYKQQRGYISQI